MPNSDEMPVDAAPANAAAVHDRRSYCYALGVAVAIVCGFVAVAVIWYWWPPRMGIRFAGATRLVFEIAETEAGTADGAAMNSLVYALSRRIDPARMRQLTIRPLGERQVEIITPAVEATEVQVIKKLVVTAGVLQFRIVANQRDHAGIIELAAQMSADSIGKRSRQVRDADGKIVGVWARVLREEEPVGDVRPFQHIPGPDVFRNTETGELIKVPEAHRADDGEAFARYIDSLRIADIDILMATDDGCDVTGAHLGRVAPGLDDMLRPCINISLRRGEGVDRFARLTHVYSPSGEFNRQLGILIDDDLLSAPNIEQKIVGRAQITGHFTQEEVDFLVHILRSGTLPVRLAQQPVVEQFVPPDPSAAPALRWTLLAVLMCWLLVLFVMTLRYRWLGAAAALTSCVPVVITLAILQLIGAVTTLSSVAMFAFLALLVVLCNAVMCECDCRLHQAPAAKNRLASLRMLTAFGMIMLMLVVICGAAFFTYALGGFHVRTLAMVLSIGVSTALVVHLIQWLVPMAVSIARLPPPVR